MSRAIDRREAIRAFAAFVAGSPLLRGQQAPKLIGESPGRIAPVDELVNLHEFEPMAERKLSPEIFSRIADGSRGAFDRVTFRPRLMVNVSDLDLSVELFGEKLFAPILAAPLAHQRQFHPGGELELARGASAAKAPVIVADRSDTPLEEVAGAVETPWWFQVYADPKDADLPERIRRATRAGCQAVCVTIGSSPIHRQEIDRIREACESLVLLKGVMDSETALAAIEQGLQGIIVSNGGARPESGLAEPISVLPEIVDAVGGRIPVLVDGGFRRGSDVLKALAFGATAVLIGRPLLWGLAAYGATGVQTVIELIQTELARDMAMLGAANPGAVNRALVRVHRR